MVKVLNYPGAKWGLAKNFIRYIPKHHSYLEPFFGSGAVFFSKEPSRIETINDLDSNVINLFDCIRTEPERLQRRTAVKCTTAHLMALWMTAWTSARGRLLFLPHAGRHTDSG